MEPCNTDNRSPLLLDKRHGNHKRGLVHGYRGLSKIYIFCFVSFASFSWNWGSFFCFKLATRERTIREKSMSDQSSAGKRLSS